MVKLKATSFRFSCRKIVSNNVQHTHSCGRINFVFFLELNCAVITVIHFRLYFLHDNEENHSINLLGFHNKYCEKHTTCISYLVTVSICLSQTRVLFHIAYFVKIAWKFVYYKINKVNKNILTSRIFSRLFQDNACYVDSTAIAETEQRNLRSLINVNTLIEKKM